MKGKVLQIFICPAAGDPMIEIPKVIALQGVGLEGDRCAGKQGAYSRSTRITVRDVSLIAVEAMQEANLELDPPFTPQETRRNIVTQGVSLNDLVGKHFSIGKVKFYGVELCDPCKRPSALSGKPGFSEAFYRRGGLRASILTTGTVSAGDEISLEMTEAETIKLLVLEKVGASWKAYFMDDPATYGVAKSKSEAAAGLCSHSIGRFIIQQPGRFGIQIVERSART